MLLTKVPMLASAAAGRLRANAGGSIAPIVAIVAMQLFLCVGAAVDFGRCINTQTKVQNHLDEVALMAGRMFVDGDTVDTIRSRIVSYVSEIVPPSGELVITTENQWDANAGELTLTAHGQLKTKVLGIVGVNSIPFTVRSKVTASVSNVQIALVLDNTLSMAGAKLNAVKSATNELVDSMESANSSVVKFSVALVPYNIHVAVPSSVSSATWMSPQSARSTPACIGDRSAPDTTSNAAPGYGHAAYPQASLCLVAPMVPLTSDLEEIRSGANAMYPANLTNIPIGLVWGWNMLTPGSPLHPGGAVPTGTRRYLILATDGYNNFNSLGSLGWSLDRSTSALCTSIKADDITIFTIRILDGNASLLRACASGDDHYYDASTSGAVGNIFRSIMQSISTVRLAS